MTFTNTYRHSDKCLKPSCLRSFGKIGIEVMALNSGDLRLIQKALKEVRTMGPTRVVIGGTWTHHDLDVASVQNQGWFWLWDKQSGTGGMSYIDSFWYRITSHTETFETKHAKTVMAGLWLQRAYTQNKNHSYNSKVFSLMFNLALRERKIPTSLQIHSCVIPSFALLHMNIPLTFSARCLSAGWECWWSCQRSTALDASLGDGAPLITWGITLGFSWKHMDI